MYSIRRPEVKSNVILWELMEECADKVSWRGLNLTVKNNASSAVILLIEFLLSKSVNRGAEKDVEHVTRQSCNTPQDGRSAV